jgi:hypothetical protein
MGKVAFRGSDSADCCSRVNLALSHHAILWNDGYGSFCAVFDSEHLGLSCIQKRTLLQAFKSKRIMDKEASEWTTAVDQSSEECEKSEKTND